MNKNSSSSTANHMWIVPLLVAIAFHVALVLTQHFAPSPAFIKRMNDLICMMGYFHATCYHVDYNHIQKVVLIPLLVIPYVLGFGSYFVGVTLVVGSSPRKKASASEPFYMSMLGLALPVYMMIDILYDFPLVRFIAGGHFQYELIPTLIYGTVIIVIANALLVPQVRASRS